MADTDPSRPWGPGPRPLVLFVAVAVCAGALAACGATSRGPGDGSAASQSASTPSAPATTANPGGGLRVVGKRGRPPGVSSVLRARLGHGEVLAGDQSRHHLAETISSSATHRPRRVQVIGLGDGHRRTVAKTSWPQGVVQGAVMVGEHTVVYNDQDRVQGMDMMTRWKLVAVDLRSGHRRILAASGSAEPWSPHPSSNGHAVLWTELRNRSKPHQDQAVFEWRPGWREPRVILRHSVLNPDTLALVRGRLVYASMSKTHTRRGHGIDLFAQQVGSSQRQQLSHSGLVTFSDVAGGHVAWTELNPKHGALDDPWSQWVAPLDGGHPVRLEKGYSGGNTVTGRDFVAWWTKGSGIVVSSLNGRRQAVIHGNGPMYIPFRMDAHGHRLAFATQHKGAIVLHVVRISL